MSGRSSIAFPVRASNASFQRLKRVVFFSESSTAAAALSYSPQHIAAANHNNNSESASDAAVNAIVDAMPAAFLRPGRKLGSSSSSSLINGRALNNNANAGDDDDGEHVHRRRRRRRQLMVLPLPLPILVPIPLTVDFIRRRYSAESAQTIAHLLG